MTGQKPTLYLLCGKIAAGKSTLADTLADRPATVLISEDFWMATLYPGEIASLDDYRTYSSRVRQAVGPHVQSLLQVGLSVVLDFPANTSNQRAWMREIIEGVNADHELHYLDVPDDICKARLKARNAKGDHDYQASEAEFDLFTSYFVPPSPEEGLNIITHTEI